MGTEADDLDDAMMHHRAGRLEEAAARYRAVLLHNPRQPDALYLLGMIAHQTGRSEAAVRLFRQALAAKPDHAHCWNLLGLALAAAGDDAGAEESFRRAIGIQATAGFFLNLGNLRKAQGRETEAADAYREALRCDTGFAAAHYSLGNLHRRAGELEEAAACFRRALDAEPAHGDSLAALGQTLNALGRAPEALPFLEQAARLAPADAGLRCDLGDALAALGRGADAARYYETAIAADPGLGRAWFASGCLARDRHEYRDAAERFRKACQLRPDWAEAHHNLGQALFETGQVDEALSEFALAAEAGSGDVSRAMAAVIVPGGPSASNATILATRQDWARRAFPRRAVRSRPSGPGPEGTPNRSAGCQPAPHGSRLRIGYLSAFFHRRNWMKPVWGAIHAHDRTRFEIHLFSDGPEQAIGEEYRRPAGDVFHDISALSNAAAAEAIEQSAVDVLVDLNGYSAMARLPLVAARPAPVVVGWFNLYATSGMEAYDWLVGDEVVIPPDEERFYCERIARVPGTYLAFEVGYSTPEVTAPPCLESGGRLAFGSLASQYKITPEVIAAWSAILRQAPGSTLLLKNRGLEADDLRRFVRAEFEREGIGADRLVLEGPAEHDEFLKSYARIDVALDPFPYNGGTTTIEALWQGVPVLCFRGDRWAARTSASLAMAAGLGETVAADRAGYVALAIELARDPRTPERLAELRRNMRDRLRRSAACDTAGLARHLERIYREAVVFSPR